MENLKLNGKKIDRNVPYNEHTKHIYETVARIAREIKAAERKGKSQKKESAA